MRTFRDNRCSAGFAEIAVIVNCFCGISYHVTVRTDFSCTESVYSNHLLSVA
nr:MAG TPA: hypothetical protein [Caudoviricetes sp.]